MTTPVYNPNGMFSSRATVEEAVEYSQELINTLPLEHRMAAITALWVSLNTALRDISKKDLANTIPFAFDAMPTNLKVGDMSPELATRIVRSVLINTLSDCRALQEFPIIGTIAEPVTIFTLMVSRMFDLTLDDLISEAKSSKPLES